MKKSRLGVPRTHLSSMFELFSRTEWYGNGMEWRENGRALWSSMKMVWKWYGSGMEMVWSGMEDVVRAKYLSRPASMGLVFSS